MFTTKNNLCTSIQWTLCYFYVIKPTTTHSSITGKLQVRTLRYIYEKQSFSFIPPLPTTMSNASISNEIVWWLFALFHLLLLLWAAPDPGLCQQQMLSFPVRLPRTVTNSTGQSCPSQDAINAEHRRVRDILEERSVLPCSCGGDGGWTRVAYLNMSDLNQRCPANWTLTTSPVRGCGRSSDGSNTCNSVFYPVLGHTYSSVCGRVLAYQRGVGVGFYTALYEGRNTTDSVYVSGVSLTHGPAGSRQHIWTFAAALGEQGRDDYRLDNCPCTNTNVTWPYQVPSFIGNDYFCDTANRGPGYMHYTYYPDDPLWDGKGCGYTSTCCEYNTPPWFCKSLPQPTSDDLELRICNYLNNVNGEDKVIYLVDIFIK